MIGGITATVPLITQLVTLGLDTWDRIRARHAARESLSQGEKIRAALAQTDKNTELYKEIVAEAERQQAEKAAQVTAQTTAINSNLAQLDQLMAQLKQKAQE